MSPERVADRELARSDRVRADSASGFGERIGAALASPIGVLIIVPGLVLAVGLFLTVLGQKALRDSTRTLGGDRFAEQTGFIARSIASSLSHADPLLDRMRELAIHWTPDDAPGPLAHTLRGLVQGRPGIAYASVSFPDGTFRGLYLEEDVLRFVDSRLTASGTVMRRFNLLEGDGLAPHQEDRSTYDPRTRVFYRQAVLQRRRVWTKPYTFFSSHQTGVTRSEPVFEPGDESTLHAVLTADFDVHALSQTMPHNPLTGVKTLLYAADGTLLAYPEGAATLTHMALPPDRPVQLGDLGDPVIDAFFAAVSKRPSLPNDFLTFTSGREPMLAMVAAVPQFPELAWNAASIVPEPVFFRARVEHERQSLWVAALSLLVALAVSFVFARHVVRVRREAATAHEHARQATERARELGSYRLVELLGKGGMGEVWRAEHRLLAREAAVKLIRAEKLSSARPPAEHLRQRFRREAQTLATLKSRHTINLFDYGVTDDGTFFFVMELLDGMDLETLVRRDGPQPVGRVIHILLQALSSLSEAHDAGLVHRDVKPANLFVCRAADEVDIVKVLDFGLVQSANERSSAPAKRVTVEQLAASRITQAGQLLGTPAFMSPEQILGEHTDGRSDLYALGCVALWLLSGKVPFEQETALATMVAHVNKPLPELSTLVSECLPPELERILRECLAKSPDQRPRDARTLAASLRAITLQQTQIWSAERAEVWWKQRVSDEPEAPSSDMAAPAPLLLIR